MEFFLPNAFICQTLCLFLYAETGMGPVFQSPLKAKRCFSGNTIRLIINWNSAYVFIIITRKITIEWWKEPVDPGAPIFYWKAIY